MDGKKERKGRGPKSNMSKGPKYRSTLLACDSAEVHRERRTEVHQVEKLYRKRTELIFLNKLIR